MASRIDAINPNVLERSTPTCGLQSVVPCRRLETENRLKEKRSTDRVVTDVVEDRDGSGFVMEPVCGHQKHAGLTRSRDHGESILLACR